MKMSFNVHDTLLKALDKFAKDVGGDESNYSVETGSRKGYSYLGDLYYCNYNDAKGFTDMFIKTPNRSLVDKLSYQDIYNRERYIYETVLPAFKTFEETMRNGLFWDHYPRYFQGFTEIKGGEFIVTQNLKSCGYVMLDRQRTMDEKHLALVLRTLARFHAVSLAMKHFMPKEYRKLTNDLNQYPLKFVRDVSLRTLVARQIQMGLRIVEGDNEASRALNKLRNIIHADILDSEDPDNCLVITHGDVWCGNLMFKYDDPSDLSEPTDVRFLDWQQSRNHSPVFDIQQFLFHHAPKHVLECLDHFVSVHYYLTVHDALGKFNLDSKNVLPYEVFSEHWHKYAKITLLKAISTMQLMLTDDDDLRSLAELCQGRSLYQAYIKNNHITPEFRKRMKIIIDAVLKRKSNRDWYL